MATSASLSVGPRILRTDAPCIVTMQQMLAKTSHPDAISLAQGVVHWPPPPEALTAAQEAMSKPATHLYTNDEGTPELVAALKAKMSAENKLDDVDVMVTCGANQAYMNVVTAVLDAERGDKALLTEVFYFNHLMALQMSLSKDAILFTKEDPASLLADPDDVERVLTANPQVKLVTISNPCNPTGAVYSEALLRRLADTCAKHDAWLVIDSTYEYFVYDGGSHATVPGSNVLHIFSMSKAFGMMGWRVGWLAYPDSASTLRESLLKVQDTMVICPPAISQAAAVGALKAGKPFVEEMKKTLEPNRAVLRDALSPLGAASVYGGAGAFYLLARLPEGVDDTEFVKWLVGAHGVVTIPGSACGAPGCFRVAFGNVGADRCATAAARLKSALEQVVADPSCVGADEPSK